MRERIDLSKAPSTMEQMAAQWSKPKPKRRVSTPAHRPAVFDRPPTPKRLPAPPRIKPTDIPPANCKVKAEEERMISQTEKAKLLAYFADPEPDPAPYANTLDLIFASQLMNATRCTGAERAGQWEVPDTALVAEMRAMGLIYYGKGNRCLTFFALAVRKELQEHWA